MQFISNVKQIPSELLNYHHNNQHQQRSSLFTSDSDNKNSWFNILNLHNINNNNNNNDDNNIDIKDDINIQKDNKINNIDKNKYNTNKTPVLKVSSRLHERIKEGLDAAIISSSDNTIHGRWRGGVLYTDQFRVVNEVSCFDGVFPVDIMIYRNNQIVAMLEIDGPHHYR
jgi:hypothetical protein